MPASLAPLHPFGFLNPESLNIHGPWGRWCVGVVQNSLRVAPDVDTPGLAGGG